MKRAQCGHAMHGVSGNYNFILPSHSMSLPHAAKEHPRTKDLMGTGMVMREFMGILCHQMWRHCFGENQREDLGRSQRAAPIAWRAIESAKASSRRFRTNGVQVRICHIHSHSMGLKPLPDPYRTSVRPDPPNHSGVSDHFFLIFLFFLFLEHL